MNLLEMSDADKATDGEAQGEAVRRVLLPGVSNAQVAQDLGSHSKMPRKWIRLALGDSNPKLPKSKKSAAVLAGENQRLQKVLAQLKIEHDNLKNIA